MIARHIVANFSAESKVKAQLHVLRSPKLFTATLEPSNDSFSMGNTTGYRSLASWIIGLTFSIDIFDWEDAIEVSAKVNITVR